MSDNYTELVKRLRDIHPEEFGNAWDFAFACQQAMHEAADAIEELQDTVQAQDKALKLCADQLTRRWIPVTELPEEDGWYQVYAPYYSGGSSSGLKNISGNMYSAFKHGKWSIEVGYHKRPGCVKAWMPLPEPPKGEERE